MQAPADHCSWDCSSALMENGTGRRSGITGRLQSPELVCQPWGYSLWQHFREKGTKGGRGEASIYNKKGPKGTAAARSEDLQQMEVPGVSCSDCSSKKSSPSPASCQECVQRELTLCRGQGEQSTEGWKA